jgi:hypothetical protein
MKRLKEKRPALAENLPNLVAQPSNAKRCPPNLGQSVGGRNLKARSTTEAGTKKGRFYKPLQKEFRRDGFTHRQIAREKRAAIYEQTWDECCNPSVSYEVIRIRRRDGFQIGGRFVEPAEVYPRSEVWGTDGFTLIDKDAAFAKLRELA